jgi:hypothetical protein
MTVRRSETGTIILQDACAVEDAEPLLQMLQADPTPAIDWTTCSHLHTAVVQVILASGAARTGPCGDAWAQKWLVPELPERGPADR